jgi:pimeloyl-ACP methyl ester carboxylesterase
MRALVSITCAAFVGFACGCSANDGGGGQAGTSSGGSSGSGDPGTGGSGVSGTSGTGTGGSGTGGSGNPGQGGVGGVGGSVGGAGGSAGAPDPNAPIVEIPGVACGGVLDANVQTPFTQIGGRQVYIDYPCKKAKGTAVTFILNLHGTMQQETGRHYIRGYFPTYKFMDSHNLIVATPKSVVSQWGNGDGGRDEPHLMEVVNWMYTNFAGFDIRQMWVVGHSWGAMYARTFACKAEFTDKVHGVVLMSGGASMPACADRLAALGTVGETDIVKGELTQAAAASGHGCSAQQTMNLGNNVITHWPGCMKGWVHKDYLMLGKGHGFNPVDWPDDGMNADMVEAIVSTR